MMTYEEAYKNWQNWLDCMKVYSCECNKFPYCDGCDYTMVVSEELVRTSMNALEKQIPKKPTMFDNCGNVTALDRCCKCHEVIYNTYSHCPYCGQAIYLDEVE